MTLYELEKTGGYQIASLLTTVTDEYDRISMHGVRRTLLERQAESLGLPLHKIYIPKNCANREYESRMEEALDRFRKSGVERVAFGDIFLEDLRKYREANLGKIGMQGLFPIWGRDTRELIRTFIQLGFRAVIVCVDSKVLGQSFAGKFIDDDFLRDLPASIDPCGENGEFHSFVFDGPIFKEPIGVSPGEVIQRDSFYFCDLTPAS